MLGHGDGRAAAAGRAIKASSGSGGDAGGFIERGLALLETGRFARVQLVLGADRRRGGELRGVFRKDGGRASRGGGHGELGFVDNDSVVDGALRLWPWHVASDVGGLRRALRGAGAEGRFRVMAFEVPRACGCRAGMAHRGVVLAGRRTPGTRRATASAAFNTGARACSTAILGDVPGRTASSLRD